MSYFWVEFDDGSAGTVQAESIEMAFDVAEEHEDGKVEAAYILPYPATPIIYQKPDDTCPPFCYTPNQCKGRTCCLKDRACSE